MARPKAADYEQQRDRIVACAVQVFARHGYASASLSELAEVCGASKARVYHYFDSKEAVLFEALIRHTDRLLRVADEVRDRGLSPADELRALIRGFMLEIGRARDFHIVLLNDAKNLAPAMRETIRQRERRLIETMATVLAAAYPRQAAAAGSMTLTMTLLGTINAAAAWLRSDGPTSHEAFAGLVIRLFDNALSAATPLMPAADPEPGRTRDELARETA